LKGKIWKRRYFDNKFNTNCHKSEKLASSSLLVLVLFLLALLPLLLLVLFLVLLFPSSYVTGGPSCEHGFEELLDNEIAIDTREVAGDWGKLYSDTVRRWRRKT
jgi:hypothetical protein